jgi:hypothetical protein
VTTEQDARGALMSILRPAAAEDEAIFIDMDDPGLSTERDAARGSGWRNRTR